MATNGDTYFKVEGEYIYLTAPYCEFYIPEEFFKDSAAFAVDMGETIKAIGLFNVAFFKDGEMIEQRLLNIPTWIDIYVNEFNKHQIQLPHSEDPVLCRVLSFYEGNRVMNAMVIEDSEDVLTYLQLICAGKIPSSVPYSKSAALWKKNQELAGVSLGVPSMIEELILSTSYRSKKDPTKKFASVIGRDPNTSEYDYEMASIREICRYQSTFAGITFEDMDSMITSSLNKTRYNKEEQDSPLEVLLKM